VRPLLLFLALEFFYLALSGQFHSRFLMIGGVISSATITLLAARMRVLDREGVPYEFWLRTALYVPWLLWQIVLANIDVARRVWNPKLPIAPRVDRIPITLKTGFGISTYANSITLTPGTVTIEAKDDHFIVHSLVDAMAEDLLAGGMHDRCKWIEGGKA
jgi:multicomponent Na+:H+ antiporter subunit E